MKLVVVESPAKAKTINKYLGSDYKVLASFGHIRDLPSKDGSVRPDDNFAMDYEISPQSGKHVKEIADAVKNANEIILATDPDREGEAISWHVVEALRFRKALKKDIKISRVVFYEITKKAILEAMQKPRQIDMDLVNAQQARRALDYLVGFNLSPILWRKLPGSRSAGRVQSVALKLICERDREIESFISREYWDIKINFSTPQKEELLAKLTHYDNKKLEQFDIVKEADAKDIVSVLEQKKYNVDSVEKKQTQRYPQAPFTTSSLQQEAARKLRFTTKKTMMVAQKLYEGVNIDGETLGLITYMRTDAVTVSRDAIEDARKQILSSYGKEYLPYNAREYKTKAKNSQEAHEAIRPTSLALTPSKIAAFVEPDYLRLYELIWKRMLSSQMQPAIFDLVTIDITSNDKIAKLRANGSTMVFDGYLKLYKEDIKSDDDAQILPQVAEKAALDLKEILPEQHHTKPPARYSEASLVKKMEELGIGRPSTYASIISVLQDRQYVKLDKRRFISEDRGRIVTAFLQDFFNKYVEYGFTAELENELDEVANGKVDWKNLLQRFWVDFYQNIKLVDTKSISDVIDALNESLGSYLFSSKEDGTIDRSCPTCNTGILGIRLGKFGAFVGCSQYPECKYTKKISAANEVPDEEGNLPSNDGNDKNLGTDPVTGLNVLLRKGPYGSYVQLGEDKGEIKAKKTAIPSKVNLENIDLNFALNLLSLPRIVGTHPETQKEITASIGRFGPYLKYDNKFISIKDDDITTIGINRAVSLIAENAEKLQKAILRVLGNKPNSDEVISINKGRFGPYIKCGKNYAPLTKGTDIEKITLEEAAKLLAGKEKKSGKAKKTTGKKPDAKKSATKKTGKPVQKKKASK